jgi:peroxiredoxin (alkyl hydroperoxide reductase subunit C)
MSHLIGQQAPDFIAPAVRADNSIYSDFSLRSLRGKYVVLFFYPLDFTFVCPTEILEFSRAVPEFEKRGAQVVGVSVDSAFSHLAWRNTPVEAGGIGNIQYPLVADLTKQISRDYGVLLEEPGISLRGTFLIDRDGVVKHAVLNDPAIGRNINETLRTLDAVIHHEKHGEVCPANWKEGEEAMKPTTEGVASYLSRHQSQEIDTSSASKPTRKIGRPAFELPEDLTLAKAIDFAVTTERLGERVYTRLAIHFRDTDKELSQLFAKLAADEKHHGDTFLKLREAASVRAPLSFEEQQYLKAFAISNIFSNEKSPGKNTIEVTSREDALERAFHLEKTTLQYYKAMRELLDEPILDEMVAEEKRHLEAVMKYLVSGAEVRGLGRVEP